MGFLCAFFGENYFFFLRVEVHDHDVIFSKVERIHNVILGAVD